MRGLISGPRMKFPRLGLAQTVAVTELGTEPRSSDSAPTSSTQYLREIVPRTNKVFMALIAF